MKTAVAPSVKPATLPLTCVQCDELISPGDTYYFSKYKGAYCQHCGKANWPEAEAQAEAAKQAVPALVEVRCGSEVNAAVFRVTAPPMEFGTRPVEGAPAPGSKLVCATQCYCDMLPEAMIAAGGKCGWCNSPNL